MNIGELAQAAGVTTDTVRYYEKQKLLPPALRQDNGYRRYTPAHLGQLRFVRSAQGLGFSLREIRDILPALNAGRFKRGQIEERLHAKLAEIDQHLALLNQRRQELLDTFALLKCSPETPLAAAQATAPAHAAAQPRGRKPAGTQRAR
ncbi:MerR family transcriptional regulator [Curvibacter sp. APW13]|uniref:MerR family transcriptional regulator n=1 Tax=Curvibacter sp. APW13 TaxID=3077236 RepID=UPI0028DFDC0B|nr:MerR family transcriptional regulator [Curvibacter sp. APW13]MDT8992011.1 MerR family transcriptional regulator [Curvibacter sp. APW13]